MNYAEYSFGTSLNKLDPDIAALLDCEKKRQKGKIILIPSESICPPSVLEALGSEFCNVYAEGYIPSMMEDDDEKALFDYDAQLTRYRRYSDRRFYKGCEYVNILEAVAARRAARLFETAKNPAEHIHVNVQPLSGSSANNAVYDVFVEPGDTVMGLSLMHGGHLTHGSQYNRSGKTYNIVAYEVDDKTGRLDYEAVARMAEEHRPRLIIAGFTSYPWAPDWKQFRRIADSVGAFLFADVSHPAGLIVSGMYPNPIDYADVTVCTTHKTLFGPRGAIIMTTNPEYAERIDRAVFPGEQGGPHVNKFAAMAVAFKIAAGEEFREVQRKTVEHAKQLGDVLVNNGLKLAYGGTDTHLLLIDLNSLPHKSGCRLKGDTAVRILDLCSIVCNKNTIPGDLATAEASGIRVGTPWITQRGISSAGIREIGEVIAHILQSIKPFSYEGITDPLPRGKIELEVLEEGRRRIGMLADSLSLPGEATLITYPFDNFEYASARTGHDNTKQQTREDRSIVEVKGRRALLFLDNVLTCSVSGMKDGESRQAFVLNKNGVLIAPIVVCRLESEDNAEYRYLVLCQQQNLKRILLWFRSLSDGYVIFDNDDVYRKVDGPVIVRSVADMPDSEAERIRQSVDSFSPEKVAVPVCSPQSSGQSLFSKWPGLFDMTKTYFIGQSSIKDDGAAVKTPAFLFQSDEEQTAHKEARLKPSCLFEEHKKLNGTMVPFAGWEMPVRYTGIGEEHRAVREAAGLFDISHMGVLEISGEHATKYLNTVFSNYVPWIDEGESQYGFLLDIDGGVLDDAMIYKRCSDCYLMVVNAVNTESDFAWLRAVAAGDAVIDSENSCKTAPTGVHVRDLKGENISPADSLVNVALQGPRSLDVLRLLTKREKERKRLDRLQKSRFVETELEGCTVIVSRTGYTGEELGFELFVNLSSAQHLWTRILDIGRALGVKPVGLGARDSLRTEAGLPLYGHELAGIHDINPLEAGFGSYVKFHKAFFIGRDTLLKRIDKSNMTVIRFGMLSRGVRIAKSGDFVISTRTQRLIGHVTSCAVNSEGFQVGMAYVDRQYAREGVRIGIVSNPAHSHKKGVSLDRIELGDTYQIPVEADIVSRFPNRS